MAVLAVLVAIICVLATKSDVFNLSGKEDTEENAGVVSLTIHLHHPISITANKPHIYVDDVTFQKYPQLSPHASEDFIKVL